MTTLLDNSRTGTIIPNLADEESGPWRAHSLKSQLISDRVISDIVPKPPISHILSFKPRASAQGQDLNFHLGFTCALPRRMIALAVPMCWDYSWVPCAQGTELS